MNKPILYTSQQYSSYLYFIKQYGFTKNKINYVSNINDIRGLRNGILIIGYHHPLESHVYHIVEIAEAHGFEVIMEKKFIEKYSMTEHLKNSEK